MSFQTPPMQAPIIARNAYGYFEVQNKPTPAELEAYYAQKYYQEDQSTYQKSYSDAEIEYFNNKIAQKVLVLEDLLQRPYTDRHAPSLLEIGCGEGWTLGWFQREGWQVTGLDYSTDGCARHNPQCLENLRAGDLYQSLDRLLDFPSPKFDCIWMDNILEHVLDPKALLQLCQRLSHPWTVLVIEVPNDFSPVQQALLESGHIDRPFWVVTPDHLSYFNQKGLSALCESTGWHMQRTMADFPIEWSLANPLSNYVQNKATGKASHQARVYLENVFHAVSPDKTVVLYEAMADLGLGRNIIGFCTPYGGLLNDAHSGA